jgi:large subunit ribosomal protein L24
MFRNLCVTAGIIGPGKKWSHLPLSKNGVPKIKKMSVKKGDYVLVITGSDKGKTGEVSDVYPKTGRIKVLGVNIVTKHVKPIRSGDSGKISKYDGLLHQSNVMHYSKEKRVRSRVGHKIVNGLKSRYLIETGELLA